MKGGGLQCARRRGEASPLAAQKPARPAPRRRRSNDTQKHSCQGPSRAQVGRKPAYSPRSPSVAGGEGQLVGSACGKPAATAPSPSAVSPLRAGCPWVRACSQSGRKAVHHASIHRPQGVLIHQPRFDHIGRRRNDCAQRQAPGGGGGAHLCARLHMKRRRRCSPCCDYTAHQACRKHSHGLRGPADSTATASSWLPAAQTTCRGAHPRRRSRCRRSWQRGPTRCRRR